MAVYIHDPNDLNINPNQINSVPQYQNMHIFAELTAEQKGRSVFITSKGTGTFQSERYSQDKITINFLGLNQDMKSPDFRKMTTNWYDGRNQSTEQYEGFGIQRIDVKTDSSFIPQINIQFVDIKGYAFFNQDDSPYRILFDFPPPIFELTIKGYFGKAIKYKLHLVKYTTDFKTENGNFVIDAQFVAVTFAPLADVLFKYVVNVPLIEEGVRINPNTIQRPNNTYELILKLKDLYSTGGDLIESSKERADYSDKQKEIGVVDNFLFLLNRYKDNQFLNQLGNVHFATLDYDDSTVLMLPTITNLESLGEYQDYIKSISTESVPTKPSRSLYLLLQIGEIEKTGTGTVLRLPEKNYFTNNPASDPFGQQSNPVSNAERKFNSYREKVLLKNLTFKDNADIKDDDLGLTEIFDFNDNQYVGLNLTTMFIKSYKYRIDLSKEKQEAANALKAIINEIVYEKLGMNPTIYNIFEIILDDVDTFFKELHGVSLAAYDHHNNNPDLKNIIFNSPLYKDTKSNNKIYPFPLVIQKTPICGSDSRPADELHPEGASSGKFKEERIAPLELNKQLGENEMPETDFVYDFIETYLKQGQIFDELNMKSATNDDGTNKWLPISPVDSILGSGNVVSPYLGASFTSDETPQQYIFKTLLNRFYILSQYILKEKFYSDAELRKLFAQSEALNLSIALFNLNIIQNVKIVADKYKDDINGFYDYLNNELKLTEYDFTDNREYINLNPDIRIYNHRDNVNFVGVKADEDELTSINAQDPETSNIQPIKEYYQEVAIKKWQKDTYSFTNENLIYLRDLSNSNIEGISKETKFLVNNSDDRGVYYGIRTNPALGELAEYPNQVISVQENGNDSSIFITTASDSDGDKNRLLKQRGDVINIWKNWLGKKDVNWDTDLYDVILSGDNDRLTAIILLSNFGYTLSPFDRTPEGALNKTIFSTPAVVELPSYVLYYLGALIDITPETQTYQDLYDYCYRGVSRSGPLNVNGLRIFADISDVNTHLSENDKETFRRAYNDFYDNNNITGEFNRMKSQLMGLIEDVKSKIDNETIKQRQKDSTYEDALEKTPNFDDIIKPLITRQNILNYSDLTFNKETDTQIGFQSLATINSTSSANNVINLSFFREFLKKLSRALEDRTAEVFEEEKQKERLLNDIDIITQTYYSFKNIHDKWLTGIGGNLIGYPYLGNKRRLIDLFAFVDRGMNPIGDTMLNPEIMIELFDDPSTSVFTVLSQLLSLNNFVFFPLQNFMYDSVNMSADSNEIPQSWIDSFKIDVSGEAKESPAFICMYIGGTSSYPTGIGQYGLFEDDGIVDLELDAPADMDIGECGYTPPENDDDRQTHGNKTFPWSQVRAFRVRFGEQNQTMFSGIKIDSKEYPETNESIQILSRLAGDNGATAPIPKGQNLYNLYENRSYSASVRGLGNAMIQPTQYFQIDNVPLYNGAYIILNVEHTIEQNFMTTMFSGTKLLRYPVPRVTEPLSILDYSGIVDDGDFPNITAGKFTTTMSENRLTALDSAFGIDISHWNVEGNAKIDWTKIKDHTPEIKFAFIKATQGTTFLDKKLTQNARNANGAGLKIGYYHFAIPYTGTTDNDVINDANAQANYFVNTIDEVGIYPQLQLVVDVEDSPKYGIIWSRNKSRNNLWLETFISRVNVKGFGTMIYASPGWYNDHFTTNVNNIPIWTAHWLKQPEVSNPSIPTAWGTNEWTAWQFSPTGQVTGYNKPNMDINALRNDYFNNARSFYKNLT